MSQIEIEIVVGNIATVPVHLVVLKYAQSFHGADLLIAGKLKAMNPAWNVAPSPGDYAIVESGASISAPEVLFVGTPRLIRLDYGQIRKLGRLAVEIVNRTRPQVEHFAMTIHGVGYGLDEREAFRAQIAGLWDAENSSVKKVTIVERSPQRADRLARILAEVRPVAKRIRSRSHSEMELARPVIDAGSGSNDKPHVFVAMPFTKELEDVYVFGIQAPAHAAGLLCERVDMATFTGDILERIKERIRTATLVVADLTGANPNVYLEVGYAWGLERPVLLIAREGEELKFDVKGQKCILYGNIVELSRKMEGHLKVVGK